MKNIKRVFDIPEFQLENNPLNRAFATKSNKIWNYISTREYIEKINSFSRGLLTLKIKKGDKIAIISENRTEWAITDMASQQLGLIVVPIYPSISNKDYEYIFNHSEIKLCFISNLDIYEKIKNLRNVVPSLLDIYSFDKITGLKKWKEIISIGNTKPELQEKVNNIKNSISEDELTTIVYTSGTTGIPKGVMISHKNIVSGIKALLGRSKLKKNKKLLSFLPMCHILERMTVFAYQYNFNPVSFSSIENIINDIKEVKPYCMVVVPRLLEKIYDKIYNKGKELSFIKKNLFFWAISVGLNYVPYDKPFFYKIKLIIARLLVFRKWKKALGGNISLIISGGAILQEKLCRIFSASGMKILEGYGLTESCAVASVNGPKKMSKIGSVGKKITPEIKTSEEGELLIKGDNVMMGYYKDKKSTDKVLKNGYLYTGDIGEIDENGFIKITDRKKEIFKTSGGKYIAPQHIENLLKESFFIEQVIIIGENKKHPFAIIQPDFEFLKNWCKERNINASSVEKIIDNKKVLKRIQKEIDRKNYDLGSWEKIKAFRLISDTWGITTGELTPTLKLKRKFIIKKYEQIIKDVYLDSEK